MNLAKYRQRNGYGKRVLWSRNAVAAKARKRIERSNAQPSPEPKWTAPKSPTPPFATISIQIGADRRAFRVVRWDEKRFIALGKVQAASSIVRRLALMMEALL